MLLEQQNFRPLLFIFVMETFLSRILFAVVIGDCYLVVWWDSGIITNS